MTYAHCERCTPLEHTEDTPHQRKKPHRSNQEIKRVREKLKNTYYHNKALSINLALENWGVEEEFRLASNYSAINKSRKLLIAPEKLREVESQPEVKNFIISRLLPKIIIEQLQDF